MEGDGETRVEGGGREPLDLVLEAPVLLLEPILLCSGEASAIFFLSRLTGRVWRRPRRAAEPRKPGAERTVDSVMVWYSVRPEYRNLELKVKGNFLFESFGLCRRKKEWCSTADFHRFLQDR